MAKSITKKQFLADVAHEVRALKEHATPKELSKLDLKSFNHRNITDCIYGQMTGNCKSVRAKKLMDKSCIRVMHLDSGAPEIENKTFSNIEKDGKINGEYDKQTWGRKSYFNGALYRDWSYLSALEGYICLKGAKVNNIIAFLKGETDALSL